MKKVCTVIVLCMFLISLAGCGGGLGIPTGDGGNMKVTKDGIQVEGSDGSKATISNDKSQFVMESSKGEVRIGENLDLPEGYPKDLVPLFKEESVITSSKTDAGEYSIMYISKASTKECFEYYKDILKDAENKTESRDVNGAMIIATLKDKSIAVIISKDGEDDKKSTVAVSIGALSGGSSGDYSSGESSSRGDTADYSSRGLE